jgi:DNA-binding response OmpR family regulator
MNNHLEAPVEKPKDESRRVLLVDDDKKFCRLLAEYLKPLGYEAVAAHTGPDGVEQALAGSWHAVILDMMLPGFDGLEVLRRIRLSSDVPVLMLTARGDETDRIVGLEVGADDYLPKTFSTRELLARLRSVTRRSYRAPAIQPLVEDDMVIGKLRIIPAARSAFLGEAPILLTPVEYDLLLSLARARGRVKTRDQLLEEIRERNYEVFDRSIDVHISALRKKLGDDAKNPRFIRTFRSAGYMLIHPESP